MVTIGLNCVTSFFIGNLSNKLSEELEHQAEERRRKKEEMERAKAKGLDPLQDHVIRFKVERRVSSDDLMLTDVRVLSSFLCACLHACMPACLSGSLCWGLFG